MVRRPRARHRRIRVPAGRSDGRGDRRRLAGVRSVSASVRVVSHNEHYDLAIIGSGSGNSLVTPDFNDWRIAIIEEDTFGGTCTNVGCIPTKMYVYAAEVANTVRDATRYGVDASLDGVRWRDVRDRIYGRIDPISVSGREYRAHGSNTVLYEAHAEFSGPGTLGLSTGEQITADRIVVAAGSRPVIPPEVD